MVDNDIKMFEKVLYLKFYNLFGFGYILIFKEAGKVFL